MMAYLITMYDRRGTGCTVWAGTPAFVSRDRAEAEFRFWQDLARQQDRPPPSISFAQVPR
ncbi:hypothetical protein GBZ48_31675 [Azospirillum melinis]|uniref:Uncharacterized protein n=1 Tax=Azospirillum melinis TaxID=328839 RepID=A0ABX2KMH8_9PROT|nr:hypothetical protein [Azospirillum melinis]MBP2310461.1 hypothetical protein [Azospirillum melinis]NUB03777.1 hypothetical protein [Azospirillum melinis]